MKISQREAKRLRKRVIELEAADAKRLSAWSSDWPEGVHLCDITAGVELAAQIKTARKLGHAVVVMHVNDSLRFYACKLPEPP